MNRLLKSVSIQSCTRFRRALVGASGFALMAEGDGKTPLKQGTCSICQMLLTESMRSEQKQRVSTGADDIETLKAGDSVVLDVTGTPVQSSWTQKAFGYSRRRQRDFDSHLVDCSPSRRWITQWATSLSNNSPILKKPFKADSKPKRRPQVMPMRSKSSSKLPSRLECLQAPKIRATATAKSPR